MRPILKITFTIVLLFLLPVSASMAAAYNHLSPVEVTKLKQAIEDEIYDYSYYSEFYKIGDNIGDSHHWVAKTRLYINPAYNTVDGYGEVIYKLMPYGQLY